MRIIFFGSSDYCLPVLEALKKNFQVVGVVTRPSPSLPKKFALENEIPVFAPKDKNELSSLKNKITQLLPDLAIVGDFGIIIPKEIFIIPKHKTLNIHFSKLPELRGSSPVQFTILLGKKTAWISIIIVDEKVDTGDIIFQKEISLTWRETSEELYKKLFEITAQELPKIISLYTRGKLTPRRQNHSKSTYTRFFTRQDGFIPFEILEMATKDLQPTTKQLNSWPLLKYLSSSLVIGHWSLVIERVLRALTPWPGVWTVLKLKTPASPAGGQNSKLKTARLKILKAHPESSTINHQPSTILIIDEVQLEGKKPVSYSQFLSAYSPFL